MKIVKSSELKVGSELAKLGPEPFWPDFTEKDLEEVIKETQ